LPDDHAANRCAAPAARLAIPAVYEEMMLHVAIRVNPVDRRAVVADSLAQHDSDRGVEHVDLAVAEAI
jgi:hypothetical protein